MDGNTTPSTDRASSTASPPMDSQITRTASSGDLKFSVDGDDGSTQTLSSDDVDTYDQCSHLTELLGSPQKKSKCLEKYKSLVVWSTKSHLPRRSATTDSRPAKRRKRQASAQVVQEPESSMFMLRDGQAVLGGSQPHGPVSFLHAMWKAAAEVSGYQQQDAHEFFIAALNQIHASSRGSTSISCVCVVHSTFAGQLQSDVQCTKCGNVTTQTDLVLDISLDLGGKLGKDDNTLAGCLRRFTRPENLESRCSKCVNSSNEATKRLSIRKLPPVLCFTFKRFKHDNTATKIDTHIRFPANLNMAPYTSIATGAKADPALLGPPAMYEYELFAVVNHEGQVNTGHYTNYARFEDQWYHFNDE
ncbi:hypothetical protein FS837_010552, partial [Tulasnella sp. UAMH 9824]